jgi:hypothetical protein
MAGKGDEDEAIIDTDVFVANAKKFGTYDLDRDHAFNRDRVIPCLDEAELQPVIRGLPIENGLISNVERGTLVPQRRA